MNYRSLLLPAAAGCLLLAGCGPLLKETIERSAQPFSQYADNLRPRPASFTVSITGKKGGAFVRLVGGPGHYKVDAKINLECADTHIYIDGIKLTTHEFIVEEGHAVRFEVLSSKSVKFNVVLLK